jgi:glycine hydroxymethyltransferase
MNNIAAKAVALHEAAQPEFKAYAEQVVKNASVLAEELKKGGLKLVAGGTKNHLILANVYESFGIDGKEAQERLEAAGITVNANAVPDDTLPPYRPSGIRLGTPAVTTRGLKEADMVVIAQKIIATLRLK